MKKVIIAIAIIMSMANAYAQHFTTYHCTNTMPIINMQNQVRAMRNDLSTMRYMTGSNRTYHSNMRSDFIPYEITDSIGNKYTIDMHCDDHYTDIGTEAPKVGTGYTIYAEEFNYKAIYHPYIWHKIGRLTVEKTPDKYNKYSKGQMKLDTDENLKNYKYNYYIVYDEYLDYFIDKEVKHMKQRKLDKKYGHNWKIDYICKEHVYFLKK